VAKKEITNIETSILQRLKNYSEAQREDRNLTLCNYAIERFLYRLSISKYASQFVLKGAQLFRLWHKTPYRPTRDLDLLRYGTPDIQELKHIFANVCQIETNVKDGIEFLPDTIKAEAIREDSIYDGIRIKLEYRIGRTGQFMQIDIGFGDATIPVPKNKAFPSILNMPEITVKAYAPESVIAEKVEAMVTLGIANSRMKDFYDVFKLCQTLAYDGMLLTEAVQATFKRRQTEIPPTAPFALTQGFAKDSMKTTQWNAFLRKHQQHDTGNLEMIIEQIATFIMPVFQAIRSGRVLEDQWNPENGWTH
jgi:predicted nucleotidyltransferase component of viral defense system